MSDQDPRPDASGWTPELLFKYFERRISDQDRRIESTFTEKDKALQAALAAQEKSSAAAIASADRAVQKAEMASDKRFDSVNEFRQALTDMTGRLVSRMEVDGTIRSITEKIDGIRESVGSVEKLALRGVTRPEVESMLSVVAEKTTNLATLITNLGSVSDRREGRGAGVVANWGWIVGGITLIMVVLEIANLVRALH